MYPSPHTVEYPINPLMRPKLLLGRRDSGVETFLQELGIAPSSKEPLNIVAICREEDKLMNGFAFESEKTAQEFYCAFKVAIATQLYWGQLPPALSFNFRVANLFADAFNGQCTIDPNLFQDGRAQETEITTLQGLLKSIEVNRNLSGLEGGSRSNWPFGWLTRPVGSMRLISWIACHHV